MAYTFNTLFTAVDFDNPCDIWVYTNDGQPPMFILQAERVEVVDLPTAGGTYRDDWDPNATGVTVGTLVADDGASATTGGKTRLQDDVMHVPPRTQQQYISYWQWTAAGTGAVLHCKCAKFVRSTNVAPT